MKSIISKVVSVVLILATLAASLVAWFVVEIYYDGCCGVPQNDANNVEQMLAHIIMIAFACLLLWVFSQIGWPKKTK
jgi:membrane glycosyltransferase